MGADIVLAFKVGMSVLGSQAAPGLVLGPAASNAFVMAELAKGTGTVARAGDRVTIEFTVATFDGKELANTVRRGLSYTVVMGDPATSPFLQMALDGVRPGSQRRVVFPVESFFGPQGVPPIVPQGGQLQGTLKVLKVVRPGAATQAVVIKGRG